MVTVEGQAEGASRGPPFLWTHDLAMPHLRIHLPLLTWLLVPVAIGCAADDPPSSADDTTGDPGDPDGPGPDDGMDPDVGDPSEPADPDDWSDVLEPVAGSRLRPVFRVAEDGTRAHVGWHDTLFDAPCEFQEVGGIQRCLPTDRASEPWLYADAGCTERVLQDHELYEGQQVVFTRGSGCFSHTVYEIGEPVDTIYYTDNGPCQVFSNDPSHRVVAIGDDAFVAATVTTLEGTNRVVPMLLQADDGAQAIMGAWDTLYDEEVEPSADAQGTLRWFGRWSPRVSTGYFADAGCTQPAALKECVPPSMQPTSAYVSEPGYCAEPTGHHALGDELTTLYQMSGSGCTATSVPFAARAWAVGASLVDDAFGETPTTNVGGDRLRHDMYASPEGAPLLASLRFFDAMLAETECQWRAIPYGSTHFECVPVDSARLTNAFADPACTQPTATRWVDEELGCFDGPATYAYGEVGSLIAPVLEMLATRGGYAFDDTDTCAPIPDGGDDFGDGGFGYDEYFSVDLDQAVTAVTADDVVQ